jgi:hypothetical protein
LAQEAARLRARLGSGAWALALDDDSIAAAIVKATAAVRGTVVIRNMESPPLVDSS